MEKNVRRHGLDRLNASMIKQKKAAAQRDAGRAAAAAARANAGLPHGRQPQPARLGRARPLWASATGSRSQADAGLRAGGVGLSL